MSLGVPGVNQQFQSATINVEDRKSEATRRRPMGDHPIAWCHRYDGGRAFYTALGHKGEYWNEPLFLEHVLGGIKMAAGRAPFRCET